MALTARSGPVQRQKPGTSPWSPTQIVKPSSTVFICTIQQGAGFEAEQLGLQAALQYGMPMLQAAA